MKTAISTPALAGYAKLLRQMSKDERLNATHVSLFTGLFVHWQRSGFNSPFAVTRKELMAYSKIASITTYHKCIKELNAYGYLNDQPSYHPKLGSQVYWPAGWQILKSC
jgi:Putative Zn-dependent protease